MHRDRKQTGDHQGLWGFQGRWRELGGGGGAAMAYGVPFSGTKQILQLTAVTVAQL